MRRNPIHFPRTVIPVTITKGYKIACSLAGVADGPNSYPEKRNESLRAYTLHHFRITCIISQLPCVVKWGKKINSPIFQS